MLARRNVFSELADLNETFNRFFDIVWNDRFMGGSQWLSENIPLDVAETEEGYTVKASLPGLKPDDLDITFNNNVLTISGEVQSDQDNPSQRYHLRECWAGQFQRSITLPVNILFDQIQASYDDGVLTIFLPKSEEAKPKRIQIQSGSQAKMLELGPAYAGPNSSFGRYLYAIGNNQEMKRLPNERMAAASFIILFYEQGLGCFPGLTSTSTW